MEADDFEWDDAKAASNFVKHNVRFQDATFAFDDPDRIDLMDESGAYDEVRYKLIAAVESRLFCVIYTERGARMRIPGGGRR
jgi:uncharacterized protein